LLLLLSQVAGAFVAAPVPAARVGLDMGRWDPPATPSGAAEDFMRQAAAASSGAILADDRSRVVDLPRGATGIEWGSDLSFVGVYVRAVEPGGAADLTGAVGAGDQLVAVNGTAVFDVSFDQAMELLGREAPSVKLEFFQGTRDDLLVAAGRDTPDGTDVVSVTVVDGTRVVADLRTTKGANLRDVLVGAGLDVYRGTTKWTNCNGKQLCGTCIVDVQGGGEFTNRKSNDEDSTLNLQKSPPSTRLSCVTFVYGDVTVALQPDRGGGYFGSATSGSGW